MKDKIRKSEFKFLNYLFENMCSVKSKFYPDSTFFKKDDKVILELEKSGTLWVLYSVWTDISDMFSYDYEETQRLIKEWMEEKLKSKEVTPQGLGDGVFRQVEKQLKSAEVTPKNTIAPPYSWINLKSEELTPLQGCVSPFSIDGKELTPQQMNYVIIGEIEEEIKSGEITPLDAGNNYLPFMEKQLKLEEVRPKQAVFPIEYPEEITPQESIPTQIWRDLEKEEITPRNAIVPPFRWRNLDSVKYAEIKPTISTSYRLEEKINSEEITPRQVVPGSFDWIQDQIKLGEVTPTSFFVIK
jgi:hypothetical protein